MIFWKRLMPMACLAWLAICAVSSAQDKPSGRRVVGVSLAGPEFGVDADTFSNRNPGSFGAEYTFPKSTTIDFFSDNGIRLLRIPFRWERLQPTLGGRLDSQHVKELRRICRAARRGGSNVVLDLHNYGRYRAELSGSPRTCIIDERVEGDVPVSSKHFADFWRRMASEFRQEAAVVGYALMNEPHDMGRSDWKRISQRAVDAVRSVDRKTSVLVAGADWSNAERFAMINGPTAWIRDPSNRVVYEAHCYFDQDGSGKYKLSFQEEKRLDPGIVDRGVDRVSPFLEWCRDNNVKGFVGEFGTPSDPAWEEVTSRFLEACFAESVPACYWAAGEWWGNYPLSIQPKNSRQVPPQMQWLLRAK